MQICRCVVNSVLTTVSQFQQDEEYPILDDKRSAPGIKIDIKKSYNL